MPGRTESLKKIGDKEWLTVNKVNGVEVSRNTMKLSSDSRTQTETITGTQSDGKTHKSEWTDQRVSGGLGLAGVWKGTNKCTEKDTMVYSDAGNGMLKIDRLGNKATMTVSLDGKPAHQAGPRENAEETISLNKVSPNEWKYTMYLKGKLAIEGVRTVSADGKVLKDVSWLVTKPAERKTQIYEKQ